MVELGPLDRRRRYNPLLLPIPALRLPVSLPSFSPSQKPLTSAFSTTRRRRRRGARPFYGTGWMAQGVQPQQGHSQGPPPPQYGAPQQYNQGPNQESGYAPPMPDTPKPVYGGGQNQYEMYNPPPGPPPNRYG
jgi:hypothetical protein